MLAGEQFAVGKYGRVVAWYHGAYVKMLMKHSHRTTKECSAYEC